MYDKTKLIKIATKELGYKEKASNSNLDSKTANAGSRNYTKYARDLAKWVGAPYGNGAAWCDMFFDWCMIKAYGKIAAKKMIGGWSAYTPTSASYYKQAGRWHEAPESGDQVFFKDAKGQICHTGVVTRVENGMVYTIEGNSANMVRQLVYPIRYTGIAGYGRPDWGKAKVSKIAKEVIQGKWGNGPERVKRLTAAGYNPDEVQKAVNKILK